MVSAAADPLKDFWFPWAENDALIEQWGRGKTGPEKSTGHWTLTAWWITGVARQVNLTCGQAFLLGRLLGAAETNLRSPARWKKVHATKSTTNRWEHRMARGEEAAIELEEWLWAKAQPYRRDDDDWVRPASRAIWNDPEYQRRRAEADPEFQPSEEALRGFIRRRLDKAGTEI